MKIRIDSDGTAAGTRVTDEEGKLIGYVQEITWKVGVGSPVATCDIKVIAVPINIESAVTSFTIVPTPPAEVKGE